MDNIQKLVFGVLAIAGLLAMVTPSDLVVPPPAPVIDMPPPMIEGPASEGDSDEVLADDEAIEGEEVDDDPFSTGEPSIDGNPIGQPANNNQINPDNPQPNPVDQAQYGIPNYGGQAIASYNAAPPVYNVPIGPDGFGQISGQ
jgi:hypothetical protein